MRAQKYVDLLANFPGAIEAAALIEYIINSVMQIVNYV